MTADELKTWRADWDISQSHLARLLGIHVMTVSRWEREQYELPPFLPLALETLERRLSGLAAAT